LIKLDKNIFVTTFNIKGIKFDDYKYLIQMIFVR